ncbi:781_t:CDS:2 [Racocetra fulgida]|uniref:781_t:CDS:1 n=1 Tax=Racocetra fulgida TaxID=60492 RepID=A0A9N9H2G0_9GLOM|nr:781_t:CDS:2 [Racocetra fulgida]
MFPDAAARNSDYSEFPVSSTLVNTCANAGKNDKESASINSTPFVRNILGSEFENYNGKLPLITSPIEIEVGTRFISMLVAVHYIEQYAFQNHFAVYKHKCEIFSDGTCRKRVLKCDRGGRYNERLLRPTLGKQKNKGSKKQGYTWQINMTQSYNSPIVTVTLLNTEHNHQIDIETIKFATAYKSFSQEIMEQIKYYVIHCREDVFERRIEGLLEKYKLEERYITMLLDRKYT